MDFMEGMEQRLSDIRGITLKSLLENPSFLQPPTSINKAKADEDKDGKKNKEDGFLDGFGYGGNEDVASAFLGPTLWEKTPYDELKLEYMDLDEFLSENGLAVEDGKKDDEGGQSDGEQSRNSGASSPAFEPSAPRVAVESMPSLAAVMGMTMPSPIPSPPPVSSSPQSPEVVIPPDMSPVRTPSPVHIEVPFDINETDVALATAPGQETFNPKSCTFTDAELKPQPMIKKSRKIYVPSEQKDEKYWERRRKNNIAAKRSRDARRIKENQIVIRASYLMKENGALKEDILDLKKENSTLKKIIASYEKRLNGGVKLD